MANKVTSRRLKMGQFTDWRLWWLLILINLLIGFMCADTCDHFRMVSFSTNQRCSSSSPAFEGKPIPSTSVSASISKWWRGLRPSLFALHFRRNFLRTHIDWKQIYFVKSNTGLSVFVLVYDYYSFYIINDVQTHMLLSSLYRCYLLSFFFYI